MQMKALPGEIGSKVLNASRCGAAERSWKLDVVRTVRVFNDTDRCLPQSLSSDPWERLTLIWSAVWLTRSVPDALIDQLTIMTIIESSDITTPAQIHALNVQMCCYGVIMLTKADSEILLQFKATVVYVNIL